MAEFQTVAAPGEMKLVDVDGEEVVITRRVVITVARLGFFRAKQLIDPYAEARKLLPHLH